MKEGQLRVWWIPQVPGEPFHVDVASVEEGVKIMDVLAEYDKFQYDNNIKPDYCNTGGLQMWNADMVENDEQDSGWTDWCDEETGDDDPREWLESKVGK